MNRLEEKRKIAAIDFINKMFEITSYGLTYDDIKNREDDWYRQYTMTEKQREEWKEYCIEYMKTKLNFNKLTREREFAMFDLCYGLKIDNKGLKPIHKLNGGIGATLCHTCSKIISEGFTDDLYCQEHGGKPNFKPVPKWKYTLIKQEGGSKKVGNTVVWVEWDKDNRGKKPHKTIAVGRSLLLDPIYGNYTWLTTSVVEVIKKTKKEIVFKTKNSTYTLIKNF